MRKKHITKAIMTTLIMVLAMQLFAGDFKQAPNNVAVALLVKVLSFEKRLSITDEISIFVLNNHELAEAFIGARGEKIGRGTISEIISGSKLPRRKPTIICIGADADVAEITAYTRKNEVMSVTIVPDMVDKGVSLGVGIGEDNKPKIMVNLVASKEEGLEWNTAILKSAKVVK